jgi:hypothetical protein
MAGAAPARLHLFGIRHHGPGSARSLLTALGALDPAIVLIEGPPDANDIIRFAASPAMVPPIAMLVHGQDDPANASFYPFGIYSPEWQAMRWAMAGGRPVRFIDLPAANKLALRAAAEEERQTDTQPAPAPDVGAVDPDTDDAPPTGEVAGSPRDAVDKAEKEDELSAIPRDPLAYLATIAGYADSEAWWNALIEQGANAPTIFAAIELAMTELRTHVDALGVLSAADKRIEDQREAHMRLAIASALRETDGAVAVVCGAWHVPALRRETAAAEDRALLKGLPKIKVTATWVPWTDTRLASASGYGAGVSSPGWYTHLWKELDRQSFGAADSSDLSPRVFTARWQTRVAGLLRANGRQASTASVIEASRLAETLASLRDLALPGLDEMREASLATLCLGETAPWRLIETELVIGGAVGEIAADVPQMPLQADLTRWQKKLKLKPEALDRDVSLDLRADAGLAKSLLLHRLNLINVTWGRLLDAGSSRGTFRENWKLRWEPELSVRLAEALVHGTTVEQAAGNAAIAAARKAATFRDISAAVRDCLLAGLGDAARVTIGLLQGAAAVTSDVAALAGAIPPLVTVLRYGTAREMPAEELQLLVTSLAEAVCSGLVYACRNLQAEEAETLRATLIELDQSFVLLASEHLTTDWRRALARLADDAAAQATLRGFSVRALYDQGTIADVATSRYLSRALSRAVPPIEAGQWLDGFLGRSGQVLLHDDVLTALIDGWISGLGEDEFTAILPMLRRAFSSIDRAERRRLLDKVRRPTTTAPAGALGPPASTPERSAGFEAALPLLLTILGIDREKLRP